MRSPDEGFMQRALVLAEKAFRMGEIPVGAVVVKDAEIIGEGFNERESRNDPTAHAEIVAIRSAAFFLRDWRVTGCSLYVTLEPCPMCMGAVLASRFGSLFYGASDERYGASTGRMNMPELYSDFHKLLVCGGIMEKECKALLTGFLKDLRLHNL
jgi:tRNA(adenine34) deaminase